MQIKVLGAGCERCAKLEQMTREAVEQLGLDAEVLYITDIEEVMSHGVMTTPAIVIDGEVRLAGRIPTMEQLISVLGRS